MPKFSVSKYEEKGVVNDAKLAKDGIWRTTVVEDGHPVVKFARVVEGKLQHFNDGDELEAK